MLGQTVNPQKPQIPHEPTHRDDAKKVVSEILKRVDQLIRQGNLDHAQLEISKAKAVDPRNVYVFALEERISILKDQIVHVEEKQTVKEPISAPVIGQISKPETKTPQMPTPPKPEPTIAISSPTPNVTTSSILPSPFFVGPVIKPQEKREDRILDRSADLDSYRQALIHAWSDGALTENEERQLNELRTVFDISKADYEHIEKDVKYECYRNALLRQLSDNSKTFSDSKSLTELQHTFQISDEEHLHIQTQLMNTIQHKQRDKVLVIDDDTRLLELLAASLEDSGFDVTALPTSDEAYALLRKFVPDLILCDINLETSTMGGFTFYEKVQELKSVQSIPFVFLTGLTDEALVRTGKELGVDDYLMKPISEQTLVSTLRGKLKRFRQLNKIITAPLPTMAAA
ncbi:MAG: response regulator [Ignavibacteriales bacterium]|nr:response regulator [Ignavibacteriales bacterium]